MNKFETWVKAFGIAKLADHLGVNKSGIYEWVNGNRSPRLKHVLHIVKLSQGALTPGDILRFTTMNIGKEKAHE